MFILPDLELAVILVECGVPLNIKECMTNIIPELMTYVCESMDYMRRIFTCLKRRSHF